MKKITAFILTITMMITIFANVSFAQDGYNVPVNFGQYNLVANNVVTNILPGTTYAQFRASVTLNLATASFKNATGVAVSDEQQVIQTNSTIVVSKGIYTTNYKLVVYGDVTGDGLISVTDLSSMKSDMLKIVSLADTYKKAGTIYDGLNITISDMLAIKKHLLNIKTISQNPSSLVPQLYVNSIDTVSDNSKIANWSKSANTGFEFVGSDIGGVKGSYKITAEPGQNNTFAHSPLSASVDYSAYDYIAMDFYNSTNTPIQILTFTNVPLNISLPVGEWTTLTISLKWMLDSSLNPSGWGVYYSYLNDTTTQQVFYATNLRLIKNSASIKNSCDGAWEFTNDAIVRGGIDVQVNTDKRYVSEGTGSYRLVTNNDLVANLTILDGPAKKYADYDYIFLDVYLQSSTTNTIDIATAGSRLFGIAQKGQWVTIKFDLNQIWSATAPKTAKENLVSWGVNYLQLKFDNPGAGTTIYYDNLRYIKLSEGMLDPTYSDTYLGKWSTTGTSLQFTNNEIGGRIGSYKLTAANGVRTSFDFAPVSGINFSNYNYAAVDVFNPTNAALQITTFYGVPLNISLPQGEWTTVAIKLDWMMIVKNLNPTDWGFSFAFTNNSGVSIDVYYANLRLTHNTTTQRSTMDNSWDYSNDAIVSSGFDIQVNTNLNFITEGTGSYRLVTNTDALANLAISNDSKGSFMNYDFIYLDVFLANGLNNTLDIATAGSRLFGTVQKGKWVTLKFDLNQIWTAEAPSTAKGYFESWGVNYLQLKFDNPGAGTTIYYDNLRYLTTADVAAIG